MALSNTAKQDLSLISVPEENKLLIGDGGAGKNPDAADEVFRTRYEDILDFLKELLAQATKEFWFALELVVELALEA